MRYFSWMFIFLFSLIPIESFCRNKQDHENKSSKHLESSVEDYMWGAGEIAIGIAEIFRGDPLGGALIIADGVRNCKEAWDELQDAKEEKELAEGCEE